MHLLYLWRYFNMLQVKIFFKHQTREKTWFLTSGYMVPHQSVSLAETSSEDLLRAKGKLSWNASETLSLFVSSTSSQEMNASKLLSKLRFFKLYLYSLNSLNEIDETILILVALSKMFLFQKLQIPEMPLCRNESTLGGLLQKL